MPHSKTDFVLPHQMVEVEVLHLPQVLQVVVKCGQEHVHGKNVCSDNSTLLEVKPYKGNTIVLKLG